MGAIHIHSTTIIISKRVQNNAGVSDGNLDFYRDWQNYKMDSGSLGTARQRPDTPSDLSEEMRHPLLPQVDVEGVSLLKGQTM